MVGGPTVVQVSQFEEPRNRTQFIHHWKHTVFLFLNYNKNPIRSLHPSGLLRSFGS